MQPIFRKTYVFQDLNPDTGLAEFHRVSATTVELSYLHRFYLKEKTPIRIYSSQCKDLNKSYSFEWFLKRRGLDFQMGEIVRIHLPRDSFILEKLLLVGGMLLLLILVGVITVCVT